MVSVFSSANVGKSRNYTFATTLATLEIIGLPLQQHFEKKNKENIKDPKNFNHNLTTCFTDIQKYSLKVGKNILNKKINK